MTPTDAVVFLRSTLVSAEEAIKGREHTGFIHKALAATQTLDEPLEQVPNGSGLPTDAATPSAAAALQALLIQMSEQSSRLEQQEQRLAGLLARLERTQSKL